MQPEALLGDRRHLEAEDLTFVRWGLENVEQMLQQRPQARKKFMLDKLYIIYRCSIGKKKISALLISGVKRLWR